MGQTCVINDFEAMIEDQICIKCYNTTRLIIRGSRGRTHKVHPNDIGLKEFFFGC